MIYLGLDCSTFAIHGALIDTEEKLITLHKWSSKNKKAEEKAKEKDNA